MKSHIQFKCRVSAVNIAPGHEESLPKDATHEVVFSPVNGRRDREPAITAQLVGTPPRIGEVFEITIAGEGASSALDLQRRRLLEQVEAQIASFEEDIADLPFAAGSLFADPRQGKLDLLRRKAADLRASLTSVSDRPPSDPASTCDLVGLTSADLRTFRHHNQLLRDIAQSTGWVPEGQEVNESDDE